LTKIFFKCHALFSTLSEVSLSPPIKEWINLINIHLTDLVPIIGLALQRAQTKAEEMGQSESFKLVLRHFEKVIPFLLNDQHCQLRIKIFFE